MRARHTPFALWQRLRSSYWFVPGVMTLTAVVLGIVLTALERQLGPGPAALGWGYSGAADGARALLSAIAGSMITVVSVTFSVTIVALTVTSQHFGPRLLINFVRDIAAQIVLGTFIGTFAYCVVVLRTIQGDNGEGQGFVPSLAVTVGVVLALISVGTLIYYVHHVSSSVQISEITAGVAADLRASIDRLYPERIGEPVERSVAPDGPPATAHRVLARKSGYVRSVAPDEVLELARRHQAVVWITARPGDFVVEGKPLAAVESRDWPRQADTDLQHAIEIATERDSYQDAGFAIDQLVEVALRALSPGVNEPFTAVTCIDWLTDGLTRLATRAVPSAVRRDRDGHERVITRPAHFDDLLSRAVQPIVHSGRGEPIVLLRLLDALDSLGAVAGRVVDRAALRACAGAIEDVVREATFAGPEKRALEARMAAVVWALDR